MKRDRQELLYRKMKKTGLSHLGHIHRGGEARWGRHTKQTKLEAEAEVSHKPMKSKQLGYDYTPLFRFLLSRVGRKWDEVFSEAKSRLDQEEPIWYMVDDGEPATRYQSENRPYVTIGENSYWSRLRVNEDGILEKVDPNYVHTWVSCSCCTHTWNGKPILTDYKKQFGLQE